MLWIRILKLFQYPLSMYGLHRKNQRFFCEKYQIGGRWICGNNSVATMFYYNGRQYILPFRAVFTPVMLPCLAEAAALQIEEAVDNILLRESGFEEW